MRPLSPRESRLVALLGLVAAVTLAYLLFVAPLMAGFSARNVEREALRQHFIANSRLAAAVPRLERVAEGRHAALAQVVLMPADATTAGEFLRARMQRALIEAGGEYRGGEDGASTPGIAVARLSARVSPAQLGTLLLRLQNSRPAIVITALSASADDVLVTGKSSNMDVQLEASIAYRAAAAR